MTTPANPAPPPPPAPPAALPAWANELALQYTSGAANQFILHGNVHDQFLLATEPPEFGSLSDFVERTLLPRFDVVLTYDLGNGIRLDKGGALFNDWPYAKENALPNAPRAAVEVLTRYFRYAANLARLGRARYQIALLVKSAHLVAPATPGMLNYDLSAIALLMREWSSDPALVEHTLATFLITDTLNELHPILVNNNRAVHVAIPLPTPADLQSVFACIGPQHDLALRNYAGDYAPPAGQLAGATLVSIQSLLKTRQHAKSPITPDDLVALKKSLVENDANGLIEFIASAQTLDALYGQDKVKQQIRQDIALWRQNDLAALPMGYLLCGPVGTGKTYMMNCIAGEAGVPVVKFKNFRDKWVGSTEGNLERIFRILQALGRCFVFIDEADQALGKRDQGSGDSGVGGRVYSMFAEEMSKTSNRGKIIWVLASSRPDLIEVDLKRPGRLDVKIPLYPTTTPQEAYALLRTLLHRMNAALPPEPAAELLTLMPDLLTPGAAEALAIKIYRRLKTDPHAGAPEHAVAVALENYQSPVRPEVMAFQIDIATREASDLEFVPTRFRTTS